MAFGVSGEVGRARLAVAVVFAVHGAVAGSLATRIPWIQDHIGAGAGALGVALLAPAVGSISSMPAAGGVVHRFGGRRATRVLLAAFCGVLALPALAPGLPVLWPVLLVYGGVAGMCDVAMNAEAVVVERLLGRPVMSGLHGMWSVGGLAGGVAGIAAADAGVDARVHLAVAAVVLGAVGAVAGRWLLPASAPADGPQAAAPPRFAPPSRAVLAIGLVGFCAVFGEGAAQDWCAVYLRRVAGASPGVAAASYTLFALTMAAARLAGDRVVARAGAVRAVRWSGVIAAAGAALVAVSGTPVPAIAGFMLIGLGVAVVVPLVFAAAGNAAPTPGEGVAGAATVSYTSGFVAPSVIGWVAAATSYPVSFAVVAVVSLGMVAGAGLVSARRLPVPAR